MEDVVVLSREEYDKLLDVCRRIRMDIDDCIVYAILNLINGDNL